MRRASGKWSPEVRDSWAERKMWVKLEEGGSLEAVGTRRLKMEAGTR